MAMKRFVKVGNILKVFECSSPFWLTIPPSHSDPMGHMGSDLAPHVWQIDAAEKRADKAEQEYKAGDVFFFAIFSWTCKGALPTKKALLRDH